MNCWCDKLISCRMRLKWNSWIGSFLRGRRGIRVSRAQMQSSKCLLGNNAWQLVLWNDIWRLRKCCFRVACLSVFISLVGTWLYTGPKVGIQHYSLGQGIFLLRLFATPSAYRYWEWFVVGWSEGEGFREEAPHAGWTASSSHKRIWTLTLYGIRVIARQRLGCRFQDCWWRSFRAPRRSDLHTYFWPT